eukprot:TRINITY_DN29507_c0_g2_i1.p1 TRINITY_DN29507_c0_g2~~TRINITY_DN29507_c0_g2_i1.p1  ORF type:complete len:364 (+),score=37.55 TRINITY_DN29507_c0_g2_i1:192-1283(+)
MAGLYDDLPDPCSLEFGTTTVATAAVEASNVQEMVKLKVRPHAPDSSRLLCLDDVSFCLVLSFLSLPDVGTNLPAACPVLSWLRDEWLVWSRFVAPLRRGGVHVVRVRCIEQRSLDALAMLACSIEQALKQAIVEADSRRRRPLGCWGMPIPLGGLADADIVRVPGQVISYGELPMPRVLWSLHNEGFTPWKGVCSLKLDACFSLLPPWNQTRRNDMLLSNVKFEVGISLWTPPENADTAQSFPGLHLKVRLVDAAVLEAVALQHLDNPPCLAATCDALLFRPGDVNKQVTILEYWSLRFCFGPTGYRHAGHGETDGYQMEVSVAGRKRYRPPDICYTRVGEQLRGEGLHLLVGWRRCDGLLD